MNLENLPAEPSGPVPSHQAPGDLEPEPADSDDGTDLEYEEMPCTDAADADDSCWEAFIPDEDEDESDPEPDPGDFGSGYGSRDKETSSVGDKPDEDFRPGLPVSPVPCRVV